MRRCTFSAVALAIALSLSPIFLTPALGAPQSTKQTSDKTPEISGVWFLQGQVRANFVLSDSAPMLPWGEQRFKEAQGKVSNVLLCYPPGVPRVWTEPYPFEIISLPGRVLFRYEFEHLVREVHTDGRQHAKDLPPTYMGDSIGKWEGDTLVVDTIGFNENTWLDNSRRPHSDELHVIERLHKKSPNVLQIDITIDDPKAYTKPWTATRIFDLKTGWEISEQICEDNNVYLFPPEKTQ